MELRKVDLASQGQVTVHITKRMEKALQAWGPSMSMGRLGVVVMMMGNGDRPKADWRRALIRAAVFFWFFPGLGWEGHSFSAIVLVAGARSHEK